MLLRLDKLLSNRGICSRREVADLVKKGRLTYRNQLVTCADMKVEAEEVLLDNQPLDGENLYILLYKPKGYVCTHEEGKSKLVYELLPERFSKRKPAVQSVGRLDKDTTGLLLFTDDGQLNHALLSPQAHVIKVYEVWLDTPIDEREVEKLSSGNFYLTGDSKPLKPAKIEFIDNSHLYLEIVEGRYHQVKRMFAQLGHTVINLHRCKFADLELDGLEVGQWRYLDDKEVDKLKNG